MCVCLLSSPLLNGDGCLAVTSCLCDADSFSVSLQTLPSACEEGCSGGRFRLQTALSVQNFLLATTLLWFQ